MNFLFFTNPYGKYPYHLIPYTKFKKNGSPEDYKFLIIDPGVFSLKNKREYPYINDYPLSNLNHNDYPLSNLNHNQYFLHVQGNRRYPDMGLWKLIIFLRTFANKKDIFWVVENVRPYYDFFKPTFTINRHYFWSNFNVPSKGTRYGNVNITNAKLGYRRTEKEHIKELQEYHGIYEVDDRYALSSCVHPKIGKYILNYIVNKKQTTLSGWIS